MPDLAVLRAALQDILPPGTGVGVADPQTHHALCPGETVPDAIPRRLREFAAGRTAARQALTAIGVMPLAIPMRPDRSPEWPPGIGGSISHTASACLAATLRGASIGIDLEPDEDLPADTWDIVLTAPERTRIGRDGRAARAVFCAKEAFYKAQYPVTEQLIGFDAVEVGLMGGTFTVMLCSDLGGWRAGWSFPGRLARSEGHVLAGIVLPTCGQTTQA